ncbi:probable 2-oxoglutarate-dependent dioxygenase AOP1 [Ricinus communis]|uniref:Flavonol synthase/flavanone 3-hydroxylase, putative n=1 Tax=Ricinus communis TaxID=3988 RepID=B9RQA6_RICCO|nr:probable 2-oxoglutarate-dependent dioxygenase AOP1 [Ricinus communis]EEF46345.1 Flavonol synthase/flavanone 3-hydroxylase, putative [Ricinus communis]|eukprot:XP_002515925.1 probable 2-oxoglutarate-dependent dioxygenase AOP1 [Ricinus communis]
MDSENFLSLPMIDFSNSDLRPGTATWDLVKSQVRKAAEEYGCFQALFNKIPEEIQKATNGALEELFQLPLETKKCNVSEKPFHGYLGSSSSAVSLYESLGIVEPDIYEKVENFINVLWPEGNVKVSKILHSFSEPVLELDQIIRRMIVESLGVEKYLEEHMKSTYYFLRVAKYQTPQTTEKKTGLRAHTDKNTLTIFYQNQVDGLEIQTRNGDWIPVKFSPNSLVILFGESLKAWTNGRLYSPFHRVMMAGSEPRYSAVFFSVPKEGYIIKALEELVDEDHPLQYNPFDYSEYLKRRFADNSKIISVPPLKNYFGA